MKPKPPSLSKDTQLAHMPVFTPDELVGALHDPVHKEVGRSRPARAIRVTKDPNTSKI